MQRSSVRIRVVILAHGFLIHMLYSHKYSLKLCSCILFNHVFYKFHVKHTPRAFLMNTERCRSWYSKENIIICLRSISSPVIFVNKQTQSSVLSSILSLYICASLETRKCEEAGIYFIFPRFVVHWHSDIKLLCLNLIVDNVIWEKHILQEYFIS
jgi:hypothetical protein